MTGKQPRIPMSAAALRRRVRRITAAAVGAAALAAAALTVNLAWATDDPAASGSPATPAEQPSTSAAPSASPGTGGARTPSTRLAAPQQAPLAGTGRSHTQSGGS